MTGQDTNPQMEHLQKSLQELGFIFSEAELDLSMYMIGSDSHFRATRKNSIGKDIVEYALDFTRKPSLAFTGFKATLQRVPPIVHGFYGTVDTAALEQKMNTISWLIPSQNHTMLPEVFSQLMELIATGNKDAVAICNGLQVKYWSGTPIEEFIELSASKRQFINSHYFKVNDDVSDTHATVAYNLMCGRAAVQFEQIEPGRFKPYWSELKAYGEPNKLIEQRFPFFDLKSKLRNKPFEQLKDDKTGSRLLRSLTAGDLATATIIGTRQPVLLSIDPGRQELNIYNKEGQMISQGGLMVKKEAPKIRVATESDKKQQQHKPGTGKNKGRGL